MRRILEFVDWAARVHFVGTMALAGGGWAVTFFATSAYGWDAAAVWVASVVAGACCALMFIAFKVNRFSVVRGGAASAGRANAVLNQRATLAVAGPRRNRASSEFDKWRVTVHNGSTPASNVKMRLIGISPRPRSAEWRAEYPYPIVRAEQTLDAPAAELNPGDSEDYDAVPASRSSATGQLSVHLNTKNLSDPRIAIEPDERWELHFEVTARNADAVQFMLVVYVDDGIVQVIRGRK
jgi:hypothetical protein